MRTSEVYLYIHMRASEVYTCVFYAHLRREAKSGANSPRRRTHQQLFVKGHLYIHIYAHLRGKFTYPYAHLRSIFKFKFSKNPYYRRARTTACVSVAVCCSVLQSVAVCHFLKQGPYNSVCQCCSVLHCVGCVVMCCGVLQCVAVSCSMSFFIQGHTQ